MTRFFVGDRVCHNGEVFTSLPATGEITKILGDAESVNGDDLVYEVDFGISTKIPFLFRAIELAKVDS